MRASRLPAGWDESRIRRVLEHYESQNEDEAVAEDEAAYKDRTHCLVGVPVELLPAVRRLIARRTGRPAQRKPRITKSHPAKKRKPSATRASGQRR